MPRNGSGGYSPPQNSWNPAINSMGALPNDWMAILNDLAAAVQASIAADGQTPITGSLNFGNNRLRNVGAPQGSGDGLRVEQLGKGPDIPSAAMIAFPIEGTLFDVTGTTAITSIAASMPGRMVLTRFLDALTLTAGPNLVLPGGANITTSAGDVAAWVCLDGGKWQCWVYPRAADDAAQWLGVPIGAHIDPFLVPPKNDSRFRFILCTAGQAGPGGYNEGVLSDEAVSGSSPNIDATAKIALVGSPMKDLTVRLVNTTREFFRPGTPSDAGQSSQNLYHIHYLDAGRYYGSGTSGNTGWSAEPTYLTNLALPTQSDGGDEARPRNTPVTYYRRIK